MKKFRVCTLVTMLVIFVAVCVAFMSCEKLPVGVDFDDQTTDIGNYGDTETDVETEISSESELESESETESKLDTESDIESDIESESETIDSEIEGRELEEAKQAKIAELAVYNESDYRSEQWVELSTIYNGSVAEINELNSKAEVENYNTVLKNALMAAIKTDAQLSQEEFDAIPLPTITTTLEDRKNYSGKTVTIDVFAKDQNGNKIASTVKLGGEAVAVNWDDTEKTSYTLNFEEGENTVEISATANGKTATLILHVIYEKVPASFVFAVDAFSIGCGYVVDPTIVTLDDETINEIAQFCADNYRCDADFVRENLNSAHVLAYLLDFYGYGLDYTGKLGSAFYLSYIKGFVHEDNIPDNLKELLANNRFDVGEPWAYDELGEFDYTYGSGWMYCVNGIFPNVGFSDHYIQEGEVIRVQFTLAYGADIGGSSSLGFGGSSWFDDVGAERDRLIALMALARDKGLDGRREYTAAYEIICQFGVTASDLNSVADALEAILN